MALELYQQTPTPPTLVCACVRVSARAHVCVFLRSDSCEWGLYGPDLRTVDVDVGGILYVGCMLYPCHALHPYVHDRTATKISKGGGG